MKAIIIEDEKNNRENLILLLSTHCPSVELIGVFDTIEEGRRGILALNPDLLFLDIQLGADTVFSLLESLPSFPYEIIFVTAFDNYALRAIKFSAIDYILKPIDTVELVKSVERAAKIIQTKEENNRLKNLLMNTTTPDKQKKIAVSVADKIEFIEISVIVRCEADNNYTTLFLKSGEKVIASRTLKEFEELLAPYSFLRTHQSHLINLDEVKSFIKSDGGYIQLKDNTSIPISRQRRTVVLERLYE